MTADQNADVDRIRFDHGMALLELAAFDVLPKAQEKFTRAGNEDLADFIETHVRHLQVLHQMITDGEV